MPWRDGDGSDALIVIPDPMRQTEERVSVLGFGPTPASCLHLFASIRRPRQSYLGLTVVLVT